MDKQSSYPPQFNQTEPNLKKRKHSPCPKTECQCADYQHYSLICNHSKELMKVRCGIKTSTITLRPVLCESPARLIEVLDNELCPRCRNHIPGNHQSKEVVKTEEDEQKEHKEKRDGSTDIQNTKRRKLDKPKIKKKISKNISKLRKIINQK
ncbi:hypothetical protein F4805DRAFT_414313 [Annulohypoxylon moriforme]|nr:hypothetical protein F4805DRAFT_414313 [Annulohypoxylon moriforme]